MRCVKVGRCLSVVDVDGGTRESDVGYWHLSIPLPVPLPLPVWGRMWPFQRHAILMRYALSPVTAPVTMEVTRVISTRPVRSMSDSLHEIDLAARDGRGGGAPSRSTRFLIPAEERAPRPCPRTRPTSQRRPWIVLVLRNTTRLPNQLIVRAGRPGERAQLALRFRQRSQVLYGGAMGTTDWLSNFFVSGSGSCLRWTDRQEIGGTTGVFGRTNEPRAT